MPRSTHSPFSDILKRYREVRALSRPDFATLVGLNGSYIHRLEKGNRKPSRKAVMAMAEALDLDEETVSTWLFAAGYGPLPASETATKIGRSRPPVSNREPFRTTAAGRRASLEAMGFDQGALNRLAQAVETSSVMERKRVATIVSAMLRLITESIESPVRSAVIPAAGPSYGGLISSQVKQRLLIRAIGEAVECGIHQIILVLAPEMDSYFFTPLKEAVEIQGIGMIDLRFCTQMRPDGLGDAILQAEALVGEQPFAVLLPDDVINPQLNRSTKTQQLRLMIDSFTTLPSSNLIAVTSVSKRKLPQYGVVEIGAGPANNGALPICRLIEKPDQAHAIVNSPKALGIVGRYLLQPQIFKVLRNLKKQRRHPLELTTALEHIREMQGTVRAFPLKGARRDLGEVFDQATHALSA